MTITTRRADGSTASLSGNGQRAVEYSYDTTENHCRRTTVRTTNGTLLSQTVEDGFGRVIEETTPTTTGSITTRSEYNERGQLIRRTRTDGSTEQAPTLYEYDNVGRISRQITALCGTPTPENSAIVEYAYSAEPADDGLVYAVTRPLAIQKNGTWYSAPARLASQGSRSQVYSRLGVWLLKPHPAYGWGLTKNICETYRTDARIDLAYTYTPYGEVSPAHAYDQPLRWSSEYHDTELGLHYYNYRHYNPAMGRWMRYDPIGVEDSLNTYQYIHNRPSSRTDYLGRENADEIIITPCLKLKAKIITVGFWGRTEDEIHDSATIRLRKGFTIIFYGVWDSSTTCQKEQKAFFECFPYQVQADFSYGKVSWQSFFTRLGYKTVYGPVDQTEISMGQAVFGNAGHSNIYVISGGFSINDYQLQKKKKLRYILFNRLVALKRQFTIQ